MESVLTALGAWYEAQPPSAAPRIKLATTAEGWELRIGLLERRLDGGEVREVILATNSSLEGEATATYLQQLLAARPGVKVSRIVNLSDDLALALRAISVRIVAPSPGKNVVGMEVPNVVRDVV